MEIQHFIKGIVFSLTAFIGLCGNTLILMSLSSIAYQEKKIMPAEIILVNLAVSHLVLLITLGLPHSLYEFGVKYFKTDLDCKFDAYFLRVSRIMSIGLTCLLSCFQCVTLISSHPTWGLLKAWLQKNIISILLGICMLSMVSSISSALYPVINTNLTDQRPAFNLGYFYVVYPNRFVYQLIGFIMFSRDLVFMTLMALASMYILLVLHRHSKQMKGMRSTDQTNTAERQAAKMVVTFVVLYVLFFGIDTSLWFYQTSISNEGPPAINDIRHFLTFCFPSAFPMILITFNQKVRCKLTCFALKHSDI
ncbi:olfactory receptor class A-like protein 1 [Protopterus annectens]|uniref:olfactory receptor class A-like protein 1 n=1 Tax=Protopterus annectens TaxID=7888 RepID=UPI001CFC468D|nr:olfactory receptor class A-like protein 1 [Protopterus annectens]